MLCFPFTLCGCCAPECTDTFPFLFSYAHGRYALTGRFLFRAYSVTLASRDLVVLVSRATGLLTHMFPVYLSCDLLRYVHESWRHA